MSAVGDASGSDAAMVAFGVSAVGSGCSWKWEPIASDNDATVLKPRTCYECLNQVPEDGQVFAEALGSSSSLAALL